REHRVVLCYVFFFQAEDGIRDWSVTGVQTCALPISSRGLPSAKERVELAKMLSPEVMKLLKAASAMEAKCVRAAPKGEKPLIVEIGRASCRERVEISGGAGRIKKKRGRKR